MQPNSQSQIRDQGGQIRDRGGQIRDQEVQIEVQGGQIEVQNPQNSLLRWYEGVSRLIGLNQEEALRRDAELQRLTDSVIDTLRPTQYNFVNPIVDQVLNGANRFGYRNALAGYLASSVVSIIAVTAHCSELYKEASANGMMITAENIEKLNSYNKNRTEMRHNCIEEELQFGVPAAIFLSTLMLFALRQYSVFRARRVGQERAQERPENPENQPQAQGDQPRQAPSVLGDIVVLAGANPDNSR